MNDQDEMRRIVRNIVETENGTFADAYRATEGADPRIVQQIYDELSTGRTSKHQNAEENRRRKRITHCSTDLPASNPLLGQWWFRQDTATMLAKKAFETAGDSLPVGFIGAPTAAHVYAYSHGSAYLLDADADIKATIKLNPENGSQIHCYHTAEAMPESLLEPVVRRSLTHLGIQS